MAFCRHCGNEITESAKFCRSCGREQEIIVVPHPEVVGGGYTDVTCPKCGSGNITETTINESKSSCLGGCLKVLFFAFLLVIPVIGWITFAYLLISRRSGTRLIHYYLCRSCGKQWKFNPNRKKELIIQLIWLVVVVVFFILMLYWGASSSF
ncbi:MAG: zinc ribbon domain-containing protein [Lachnospiraceae bacterium]|jgi:DNA-directed RNA polymerase subunit M/transcription elongation factor TFIIS|nr:zinc ribbon domain-containing protein [Lachnospiraceae bacterium]